jgi:wyosine [tRNA(Phe)-imidazoG37] synthetase (radical SAM superfamily)
MTTGYVFGPVPSRRLGASLGLDLVPYKTCSFDCIYCQLGKTANKTTQRREYVSIKEIASELEEFFAGKPPSVDYVTLSGSGEPTLNTGFGRLIDNVREITDKPVAVLTNASLMHDPAVRKDLSKADVVVPTISSCHQQVFERIHRPCAGIKAEEIIDSLRAFVREYDTAVHLGVFMVAGYNDDKKTLQCLKEAIERISPKLVQINTVTRPPAEPSARPVPMERLCEIASFLGGEVIAPHKKTHVRGFSIGVEKTIADILRRRPCTLQDVSDAADIHVNEAAKYLERLEAEGKTKRRGEYYLGVGK